LRLKKYLFADLLMEKNPRNATAVSMQPRKPTEMTKGEKAKILAIRQINKVVEILKRKPI
jgi:hypothetical protein